MSKVILDKQPCPNCPSSDAYHVYDDGHGYCFSCQNYTKAEGANLAEESLSYSYQYVPWRGITASTFQSYTVQTKVDNTGKPISVGFRYPNGNYKARLRDKKDFYWVRDVNNTGPLGLFGQDKFAAGSHKYVTITEGELDACSLYQVLRDVPCVSVTSSSSAVRDCSAEWDYLNSFERIYLAFDSDSKGLEATAAVARLFDYDKVYHVRFTNRKDANEYLQHDEVEELRNIWWNAKKYKPEYIVSTFDEFEKIIAEPPRVGIPYPWATLTERTYGLRKGESVLITAQEGVGKTELMHAIEFNLLKRTEDNVGAIFLEELPRRHLQALAGLQLERPVHLPDSGCTDIQVRDALREVVQKDDRLHVHCRFGSDDPELLLDTIRFLVTSRGCAWILLDHITMAVSGRSEEDERRKLDYFATRAEMMVKELDFGLIIVSHVNDNGQTRGSRYIGKIADIRLDVSRELLAVDADVRNTIVLSIAKNRYAGQTGPCGLLSYNPNTGVITEKAANDNGASDVGYPGNQRAA